MNVIIANIISFAAHLIDAVIGYKYNKKNIIITASIMTSLMSLIVMILLKSFAGAVGVIVTIIRLIVIYVKDEKGLRVNWAYWLFIGMYASVFFDQNLLVAFLIFVTNIISFTPKWFSKDVQHIRLGTLIANIPNIISNILIKNYSAIPFCVFTIVTVTISYIKWNTRNTYKAGKMEII